jgi:threonine dehydrogenase-like Zn-dependent dehydrogenase
MFRLLLISLRRVCASLDGGCEVCANWCLGKLKPSKMITSKIQLEDLVEGGIKALIHDKESHVKILVEVGGMSRVDSAIH